MGVHKGTAVASLP